MKLGVFCTTHSLSVSHASENSNIIRITNIPLGQGKMQDYDRGSFFDTLGLVYFEFIAERV
jgi:hypothetical protein